MRALVVPQRFNGPAHSGNGGWTSGALAQALRPSLTQAVQVRLSAPPPLDRTLDVEVSLEADGEPSSAALLDPTSGQPVALATLVDSPFDQTPPEPVSWDVAGEAQPRYRGHHDHPFPTCFTCGPQRTPDDALRLEPGPLLDRPDVTACRWVPDAGLDDGTGRVDVPVTWAALDCPGGWSVDLAGRPMVLGTMTTRVDDRPAVGARHVVMGRVVKHEGRKAWTRTALFALDPTPRLLARASAVWVAVDPATLTATR